jgi:hypothetical protein
MHFHGLLAAYSFNSLQKNLFEITLFVVFPFLANRDASIRLYERIYDINHLLMAISVS